MEEVLGRQLALRRDHGGAQGDEGGGAVLRAGGKAAALVAEDGVVAVVADAGGAVVAALALAVEAIVGHAEVPATMHLTDVAADGAHMADGGRRDARARLGQRCGTLLHDLAGGHVGKLHQGADANLGTLVLDLVKADNGLEVDHKLRVRGQQLVFKRAEQVGTAGDEHGGTLDARRLERRRNVARRLLNRPRLHMREMLHWRTLQVEYELRLDLTV